MLEAPPPQSIHVTWRKCGFATYLLCLLIKQHTGVATDMTKSVLLIQASLKENNYSCRFYQCLGFHQYILEDNGFSHTSDAFKIEVTKTPQLWFSSSSVPMALFQLYEGKIILQKVAVDKPHVPQDGSFLWSLFPWCASLMKSIEDIIEKQPVIRVLSEKGLPLTDRPLIFLRSPSTMSGFVTHSHFQSRHDRSYLATDELQMLLAVMLRSTSQNRYVHVFTAQCFQLMYDGYTAHKKLHEKTQDPTAAQRQLNKAVDDLHKYLNSIHDIMEHKFLVFVCNANDYHWVTMVVVNPFSIYEQADSSETNIQPVGWFFSTHLEVNVTRMA